MSRLISRLRHRNFGVLLTTSWVNSHAYQEIREDRHPIVIVCASDIVAILKRRGFGSVAAVKHWLNAEFPQEKPASQYDLSFKPSLPVEYHPTLILDTST
jgi:hypothetical protein